MLSLFLIFIACVLIGTTGWVLKTFGEVTYSQIMFHLYQPQFFEPRLIESWAKKSIVLAVAAVLGISLLYYGIVKLRPLWKPLLRRFSKYGAWIFLCGSFVYTACRLNLVMVAEYFMHKNTLQYSDFYETHYVYPDEVDITFPENKKNLIVIFAESMETGFMNPYYFGANLMPELTKLAEENLNFSDTDQIGGGFQFDGINFTQGGLLAQYCGLPLKVPMFDRSDAFNPEGGLFNHAVCLSNILSNNGYAQSFMIGTPAEFSDTDGFLQSHGNVRLLDQQALTGKSRSNLKKHIKDADIFEYAKREITSLAGQNKPFAFTVMTMDTHFGTDTFDKRVCTKKYPRKKRINNVIACGDTQISGFIKWIKAQPFADNTVIAVLDDHLMMKGNVWKKGDDRRVFNLFINAPQSEYRHNRRFTAMDIFPTLVESLGAQIEGSRLGLGTSLYSDKKTLLEQGYSPEELSDELAKPSRLYNYFLLGIPLNAKD